MEQRRDTDESSEDQVLRAVAPEARTLLRESERLEAHSIKETIVASVKVLFVIYLAATFVRAVFLFTPEVTVTEQLAIAPLILTALLTIPLYRLIVLPLMQNILKLQYHREELETKLTRLTYELQSSLDSVRTQAKQIDEQAQQLAAAHDLMQAANARFFNLFNGVPVACFTCDGEGFVYEFNEEAERLFGISTADTLLRPMFESIVPQHDHDALRDLIFKAMHGQKSLGYDWKYHALDGRLLWLHCNVIPIQNREGNVTGAIIACLDVTDRKRAIEQLEVAQTELEKMNAMLQELATTDGLTGLANHRALQEHLRERMGRSKARFALVMVDVDHFKDFNDAFGHPAGDEALRLIGAALTSGLRSRDFVSRYGGEEFCAVLDEGTIEKAVDVAERLRKAVGRIDTGHRSVTASFGLTMYEPGSSVADLFKRADEALYRAKDAGRNRVVAWDPRHEAAA